MLVLGGDAVCGKGNGCGCDRGCDCDTVCGCGSGSGSGSGRRVMDAQLACGAKAVGCR